MRGFSSGIDRLGTSFGSISSKGELDSFQEMSDKYCLEKLDFFFF